MGQAPTSRLPTRDYWKGAELSPWGQRLQGRCPSHSEQSAYVLDLIRKKNYLAERGYRWCCRGSESEPATGTSPGSESERDPTSTTSTSTISRIPSLPTIGSTKAWRIQPILNHKDSSHRGRLIDPFRLPGGYAHARERTLSPTRRDIRQTG